MMSNLKKKTRNEKVNKISQNVWMHANYWVKFRKEERWHKQITNQKSKDKLDVDTSKGRGCIPDVVLKNDQYCKLVEIYIYVLHAGS